MTCMLNHVRSWLYVDHLSRPVVVLDGLLGLYGLKYDSATACGLPLYLCSYKLVGSARTGFRIDGRTIKRSKLVCISVI